MKSRFGSSDTEAYVFLISLFSSPTSMSMSIAISVAEDRCIVVADPLPQRRRAGEAGIGNEFGLVELARVEADRADEQLAAAVRVLPKEALERRAPVARLALGLVGQPESHRILGQEHRDLLPLVDRGGPDQECDGDALRVLEAGGEVDHDLVRHLRPPHVVGVGGDELSKLFVVPLHVGLARVGVLACEAGEFLVRSPEWGCLLPGSGACHGVAATASPLAAVRAATIPIAALGDAASAPTP